MTDGRREYSPLRNVTIASVLVALVSVLVFANSVQNRFAYDDVHIIQTNEAIQSMETLPNAVVSPYWPVRYGRELGLWRPVTTGTLGLLWIGGDGDPAAFHAFNILLHAAIAVLVVLVGTQLLSLPAAFLAGLLFAVHPLHAEAVANAIGIGELLGALFVMAGALVHLRGPANTSWPRALAVGALYALAFGSKESSVTFLGLVFLLDAARERLAFSDLTDYVARRWRLYLTLLVVASQMLLYRFVILGSVANPLGPLGADLLAEIPRIWTLGDIWMHYVRLWIFPLDLSSEYAPALIPVSLGWHMGNALGIGLGLVLLGAALVAWRRPALTPGGDSSRIAGFGVLWFAIAVSPVSNVFFLSGVLLAERTLYLPSVGLALATGWALVRLARERKAVAITVTALAVLAGGWRSWTRNPGWRDNQTMFNTLIRDVPQSGRSQWVLGDVFLGRGADREALRAYRAAIDLLGTDYILLTEVAKRLIDNGYLRAAEQMSWRAWRDSPHYAVAPSLMAIIYSEQGEADRAERMARLSLTLEAEDSFQNSILTWALAAQGRYDAAEAVRVGAEAGLLAEAWQTWTASALLRHSNGDVEGAMEDLDRAEERAVLDSARQRVADARQLVQGS